MTSYLDRFSYDEVPMGAYPWMALLGFKSKFFIVFISLSIKKVTKNVPLNKIHRLEIMYVFKLKWNLFHKICAFRIND